MKTTDTEFTERKRDRRQRVNNNKIIVFPHGDRIMAVKDRRKGKRREDHITIISGGSSEFDL
jgi:hypothetical protein